MIPCFRWSRKRHCSGHGYEPPPVTKKRLLDRCQRGGLDWVRLKWVSFREKLVQRHMFMKVWPVTGRVFWVLQPQPDIIAQHPLAAQCVPYRELRFTKHFPKRLCIECQAYYCVTLKSKHFFFIYIHGLRRRVFSLPASLLLVAVDLLALYWTRFPRVYTVELVRLVGTVKTVNRLGWYMELYRQSAGQSVKYP